jgi:hypothetical protein
MTTLEKDQQEIASAHIMAANQLTELMHLDLRMLENNLKEFKSQIVENGSAKDLEKINKIMASIKSIKTDSRERLNTLVQGYTSSEEDWVNAILNLIFGSGILYLACYGLYHMIAN